MSAIDYTTEPIRLDYAHQCKPDLLKEGGPMVCYQTLTADVELRRFPPSEMEPWNTFQIWHGGVPITDTEPDLRSALLMAECWLMEQSQKAWKAKQL